MQRDGWTDERLDDLSASMDKGFGWVDKRFERVEHDIRDLRAEMNQGFVSVRTEMSELRTLMWRLNGGIIAAIVAAILLRGI